jgi:undecaprenyl diphosphate synthase
VRLRFIGGRDRLDKKLQKLMAGIEERTKDNDRLHLTVAINYGGRDELARAARRVAEDVASGKLKPEDVGEDAIEARLDTHGLPDPDLVIRTSGEMRTSNYLLWQSAYAEYEFTDTLWPDFTAEELERILSRFSARDRRYGGALTA